MQWLSFESLLKNRVKVPSNCYYAAIIGEFPSLGARSPELWNKAFAAINRNERMICLDVSECNFELLLARLQDEKYFIGGAVAFPYKERAAQFLGENVTLETKVIGAVNCLFRNKDGKLLGSNTDGHGALAAFENLTSTVDPNSKIMIIGDGGTAKSVAAFFVAQLASSKSLTMISRGEKGVTLANSLDASHKYFSNLAEEVPFQNIIINCTSIGFGNLELCTPISFEVLKTAHSNTIIYDVIYQPLKSKLLSDAETLGLRTLNGLQMNLQQAVLGFSLAAGCGTLKYSNEIIKYAMEH